MKKDDKSKKKDQQDKERRIAEYEDRKEWDRMPNRHLKPKSKESK